MFKKPAFILLLFFLFFSCSSDDDNNSIEEIASCETIELGIDELSKFSGLHYIDVNGNWELDLSDSKEWLWSISNDTIEASGIADTYEGTTSSHVFLKKTIKIV